jgi:putative colanic acid biosynthesis UDP-glucose lipid carrier transferase
LYKPDYHTEPQPQTVLEVAVLSENAIITHLVASQKNYLLLKRVLDILISLLFIVLILSWLLPLLAVWIKLDSKGPVFFLQKRIGLNGKIFRCFKLRTMIKNDAADKKPAEENDHRITRAGRFLRKTNIDELPQFFNVFAGDMSIVGPRPHMIADCRRFSSVIPAYKFRNLVKPGITGLAQIKGYRGPATDHDSIVIRYYWDAVYVRKAGFWPDMKIIGKTIIRGIHNFTKVFADLFRQRKPLLPSGSTSL